MHPYQDAVTAEEPTPPSTPPELGAGAGTMRDTVTSVQGALEVLEPEQLSVVRRTAHVGKRALGRGTLILFGALRVYVVVMMILVVHQIWIAFHP